MIKTLLLLLLIPWLSNAQNTDSIFIKKIANEVLTNGKAYDLLRQLTKTIGGRLTGSPQMYQAEQWGLQVMKNSGADAAYLQECNVPHWVRGKGDKVAITAVNNKKIIKQIY